MFMREEYFTFFVFCKSYSMDLIRLRDSRSISSFSGGIFVGLLTRSFTNVSKCCSLCQSGSSLIACEMSCSSDPESENRGLLSLPNGLSVCCTVKILPNPGSTRYTHVNILSMTRMIKVVKQGMNFFNDLLWVPLLVESPVTGSTKLRACKSLLQQQVF